VTAPEPTRRVAAGMRGEYIATSMLALACSGDLDAVDRLDRDAPPPSPAVEIRVLIPAARAVAAIARKQEHALSLAEEAFEAAEATANYDNLICACRASADFARALASSQSAQTKIAALFNRVGDRALAAAAGVTFTSSPRLLAPLSRREAEVLDHIAEGKTNREIADLLYISEVTVKAHVRHIFEKLGVKTRTEAALRANEGRRAQAASVAADADE
jgi:DNA-binding NarL/FixJ family response regulator